MTDLYPPTGQTPPLDWITACEDDTWSAYQGALADRDRARNIAVALEQESAELRAERLRFAADYAELRAETETVHRVIEQVGLMVENWDYRYVREELQAILDGATFEEVRNG
ncbi:hypothetical protein [Pseudactinotalea sp. Z1732]|uniref:hypothetical protein n=1 Tax=Micrococcales TaxID=85006 RepID=UPI003C7D7B95